MANNGIKVNPAVLEWAVDESQIDKVILLDRFPQFIMWMKGEKLPTFNQLEKFSSVLHIPFGYLFLQNPPRKNIVASEFRTISNELIKRPSKNLEDTLYNMERISQWMRLYRIREDYEKTGVVGYAKRVKDLNATRLSEIGYELLNTNSDAIHMTKDHATAFKYLRSIIEKTGIIVNVNGIVGSYTNRPLDVKEFRAFALIDDYAPLIFVNGKDSHAGRVFSIVHEFFHILLGEEGVALGVNNDESICNQATIEFLAPRHLIFARWNERTDPLHDRVSRISNIFKISEYALSIRLRSLGLIDDNLVQAIKEKMESNVIIKEKSADRDGDYWNTALYRVSPTFARALISQTQQGSTPYTEAFRLLNIKSMATFDEFAKKVFS